MEPYALEASFSNPESRMSRLFNLVRQVVAFNASKSPVAAPKMLEIAQLKRVVGGGGGDTSLPARNW